MARVSVGSGVCKALVAFVALLCGACVTNSQAPQQPQVAAAASSPPPAPQSAPDRSAEQFFWFHSLLEHISQYRYYPASAVKEKQQGRVVLRVTVARDGAVTAVTIERSSAVEVLDEAARDIVLRAQPLPAPPPGVGGERIRLLIPISFGIRDKRLIIGDPKGK